jgi:hypothetical protein
MRPDEHSPEQKRMLELAHSEGGRATTAAIYAALHGIEYKPKQQRPPIPASIRASVSRSLRRLANKGLIVIEKDGFSLTGARSA